MKDEFIKVIDLVLYVFKSLNFTDYTAQISLRDQEDRSKYIGSDENWERAEQAIIEAAAEKACARWWNTAKPLSMARNLISW